MTTTINSTIKNTIGCWYEAGDAGTWLTWFVNQHINFTRLPCTLRYEQAGLSVGHIPTDYSCALSNWTVVGAGKTSWNDFLHNLEVRLSRKRSGNNEKIKKLFYKNICYKLMPFHNPISTDTYELLELGIEDRHIFLKNIIEESNTSTILYPMVKNDIDIFAKRMSYIRPQYTVQEARTIYSERNDILYKNNIDYMNTLCNNVVTVEIDKLVIHQDIDTYKKLCNDLKMHPNKNWKSTVTDYYNKIYAPWVDIDDCMLDSRTHTQI